MADVMQPSYRNSFCSKLITTAVTLQANKTTHHKLEIVIYMDQKNFAKNMVNLSKFKTDAIA